MTNSRFWFTKSEAAELCGLQPRRWSDAIQPRLPTSAIRGRGHTLRFWGPAVAAAAIDRQLEKLAPPMSDVPTDDQLMTGPESEALERYRLAMAKLRELDLSDRLAGLVRRGALSAAIGPALAKLREGIPRMRSAHGDAAGEATAEMVEEFADALTRAVTSFAPEGTK